jgi:hypothetical protein
MLFSSLATLARNLCFHPSPWARLKGEARVPKMLLEPPKHNVTHRCRRRHMSETQSCETKCCAT